MSIEQMHTRTFTESKCGKLNHEGCEQLLPPVEGIYIGNTIFGGSYVRVYKVIGDVCCLHCSRPVKYIYERCLMTEAAPCEKELP